MFVGVGLDIARSEGVFAPLSGSTLDMYFAGGQYFGATPADMTVTRASAGYAQTSAGTWVSFASGAPRITDKGLLVEEGRTNYFLNNTAPATQTITLPATGSYTIWLEGTGSIAVSAGTATITGAGTATSASPVTINCTATGTITCTVSGSVTLAQVENGAFKTSRIDTAGASVVRAADVITLSGTSFSSWYTGGSSGSLYARVSVGYSNNGGAATRRAIELHDGTTNNRIAIGNNGTNGARFVALTASTQADLNYASPMGTLAAAYATNDFAASFGGSITTDTLGTVPVPTQMALGWDQAQFAGANLCGYIERVAYFPSRLSNATLQSLAP